MNNSKSFFPERIDIKPIIYGYIDKSIDGYIKIGYTQRPIEQRMKEHYPTLLPGELPYRVLFEENAIRDDGSFFYDRDVFKELEKQGIERETTIDRRKTEWFKIQKKQDSEINDWDFGIFINAIKRIQQGIPYQVERHQNFSMRPEQQSAVKKTSELFKDWQIRYPDNKPHFLWNAKMRFGKTFAAYQFCKVMNYTRILVLTFKPAVEQSWKEDLLSHVDFDGWQFVSKNSGMKYQDVDTAKPIVCFGSFQDYLQKTSVGKIKDSNQWVHDTKWDLIVIDEYHYGAWREKATNLTNEEKLIEDSVKYDEQLEEERSLQDDILELEENISIVCKGYLYLSGTPFRAISNGEFSDDQIFSWTYSDEQYAKQNWKGEDNPYESLPRMVVMTYQMPDYITQVAKGGEFDEFDLNQFFKATGSGLQSRFEHENEVQKWLDIITGNLQESTIDDLKMGKEKPYFPFNNARLKGILNHTVWFLPNIASCDAMYELICRDKTANPWLKNNFELIRAYGENCGNGVDALKFVREYICGKNSSTSNKNRSSLETCTITLTCGKLTTGVTIPEWTGIFMLRNLQSPETYFQSAFRVQSPWTIKNIDGLSPNKISILKKECYVFDFAPNRALSQIAEYSRRLNLKESDPQKAIAGFIKFLPVLAYNGSAMIDVSAADLLDLAFYGTTATLLARRWESALLVNVDNATLSRVIQDPKAYDAIMKIEGFRQLKDKGITLEIVVNKSQELKETKQQMNGGEISKSTQKEFDEKQKEEKSKRKQIQEKLIKFATRIPLFMYMTDYREQNLRDVITKIDFVLFTKVTGLTIPDFELLVSLGLFNEGLMNDAIFKFRRYEDSSLSYAGIEKRHSDRIGGWSTVVSREDIYN
ncbi:MAG: GIY-YIG nuclease family protein [Firmicutes bacterium]|nr:GIY-YIG nuclease family protein [Bacillota bacterium]